MKICVISSVVFPIGKGGLAGYGGLEQVAWQRAVGLAARGHDVTLVAPDGSELPGGKVFHTGPPGSTTEKRAYGKYWQILPGFDAVVDDSWNKWSYALKAEGKLAAPVLGVMHAPVHTMLEAPPPPSITKPCFVCISQDQASHLKEIIGCEARVAYNGVDPEFYKPLRLPRSGRFLFLARFSSIKGPDLAIKACLDTGVGLDLIGDTSITNEPELFQQCMEMSHRSSPGWDRKQGRQIRVIGPASRSECVYWFSQAHALLHPNERFREPFGLAPVEAMLCGCPVIAWDHGAMRETVKYSGTGALVTTYNGLVYHTDYHAKHGVPDAVREECRSWAMRFSVDHMVARYEDLITEAVKTGGW